MNLCVFIYDFPHKKTEDFLLRAGLYGDIVCVIAAPRLDLSAAVPIRRVKPRHLDVAHPRELSSMLNLNYLVIDHRSVGLGDLLRSYGVELGLIAGARILPRGLIDSVALGIINFHPGLLPAVRGLDALRWSVLNGIGPGVTAHLIDERVDAGRILERRQVPVYEDDGWVELSLRLEEAEVALLGPAISRVASGVSAFPPPSPAGGASPNGRMTPDEDARAMAAFPEWRAQWASKLLP